MPFPLNYGVTRVASKLDSLLELNDLPAHSRGGLVTFCLDTKSNPKNQDRKKLQRCRPDSLARFSVVPLPAFVVGSGICWFSNLG